MNRPKIAYKIKSIVKSIQAAKTNDFSKIKL